MSTTFTSKHASRVGIALATWIAGSIAAAGCSSDQAQPTTPVIGTGGTTSDGGGTGGKSGSGGGGGGGKGATGGADASTGGGGGTGGASDSGAGGSSGDSGTGGGDAGCTPTSDGGCFTCPQTTTQFLHQCTTPDVQCTPYDNSKLPLFHGYPLPPVQ